MNPGAPTLRHNPAPPTTPIHAACAAMSARPQSCAICPRSTDLPLPGPLPSIQTVPAPSKERLLKEPTSITTEPATAVPPQTSRGQQPRSIRPGKGEGEVRHSGAGDGGSTTSKPHPSNNSPPEAPALPQPCYWHNPTRGHRRPLVRRRREKIHRRRRRQGGIQGQPARAAHRRPQPRRTPNCTSEPSRATTTYRHATPMHGGASCPRPYCTQPTPLEEASEHDPAGSDRSPPARTT